MKWEIPSVVNSHMSSTITLWV